MEEVVDPAQRKEPQKRSRKWLRRAGKLFLALAVVAFASELGVRLIRGEQVKFPRRVVSGPCGVRINEPNARYRHKSPDVEVRFRINGQGFRADRDFLYEKPAGVKRIVSLGDSFTIGFEVEVEQCFSSILERELCAAGHSVEVLNAGVSGFSNAEALLYLERELHKYDPDVVLISFFVNDSGDNIRSALFALRSEGLVQTQDSYVPYGRVGDFLNTNAIFNLLSERSDAFAYLKECATLASKRGATNERLGEVLEAEGGQSEKRPDAKLYPAQLTAAILERLYAWTHERGIPLVIQSIPGIRHGSEGRLELFDAFPIEHFETERERLYFLPAKSFLDPHLETQLLYHTRSHAHWTPFAHSISGQALAHLVLDQGLLDRPQGENGPTR